MNNLCKQRSALAVGGAILAAVVTMAAASYAAASQVGFDVSYTVACRDVTPQEFAEANPNRRIVEAGFQVSALLRQGDENEIAELIYVIWSPERRLRVADFEPKTEVGSPIADSIEVVEIGENATSLDASVRAQINPLGGVQLSPSAGAAKTSKQNVQQKYSKLPPKQLLLASGTTNREHGVFFKLKPSGQASLEGRREFLCQFVVPKSWRGDYAYVECRARTRNRTPWTKPGECCTRRVLVGLYLQGDLEARQAAERAAHAYEAYWRAGGPTVRTTFKPVAEVKRFFRRVPGSSIVESVVDDFAPQDDETPNEKDEARKALLAALENVARLAGERPDART